MICPCAHGHLVQERQPPLLLWRCERCGGCAATIAALRKIVRHDFLQQAWNRSAGSSEKRNRRCPGCSAFMFLVPTGGPEIDLCRNCQMVWFDAGEMNEVPPRGDSERQTERWSEYLRNWRLRQEKLASERRARTRRLMRMGLRPGFYGWAGGGDWGDCGGD